MAEKARQLVARLQSFEMEPEPTQYEAVVASILSLFKLFNANYNNQQTQKLLLGSCVTKIFQALNLQTERDRQEDTNIAIADIVAVIGFTRPNVKKRKLTAVLCESRAWIFKKSLEQQKGVLSSCEKYSTNQSEIFYPRRKLGKERQPQEVTEISVIRPKGKLLLWRDELHPSSIILNYETNHPFLQKPAPFYIEQLLPESANLLPKISPQSKELLGQYRIPLTRLTESSHSVPMSNFLSVWKHLPCSYILAVKQQQQYIVAHDHLAIRLPDESKIDVEAFKRLGTLNGFTFYVSIKTDHTLEDLSKKQFITSLLSRK